VAGYSGQFTPGGYLSTVKLGALAGIKHTTFPLLVRRAAVVLRRQFLRITISRQEAKLLLG